MHKLLRIFIVIALLSSQIPVTQAYAIGEGLFDKMRGSEEPVTVKGNKVTYLQEQKKIIGEGNVSITYGDVKLLCDKIIVYTDTKEAICEGNVKITQPGVTFQGDKINYNFTKKTGYAVDGDIRAKPFYGKADLIEQTGPKATRLEEGYITTCDLNKPNYRIEAKEVELYFDDKIIAKHIIFYVRDVPILYLPLYVQPLSGKYPEVIIIPGRTTDWGYYVLSAWRYYFGEGSKGFVHLDYREKKGLAEGVDYAFDTKTLGKGFARFYYTHENDDLAITKTDPVDDRWRMQYRHSMDLPEDTRFTLIKDYLYREYEEDPNPDNYMLFETSKPNYIFRVLARKRMNTFFNVVERLPELNMEVNNQRIWNTNFYYFGQHVATNFIKRYDEVEQKSPDESLRMDNYNKLSYAAKILKFLYATPFISSRQTFYSRNRWKEKNKLRSIYEAGIDLSTRFYKVFDIKTDFLGLDLNKLRHIVSPYVGYLHRHRPTISKDDLYEFDEIDMIERYNGFNLSLETKLQTKRPNGDKMDTIDLARLIVGTDYVFRLKKGSLSPQGIGRFGDLNFKLDLNPYSWLSAYGDMTLDHKDLSVSIANIDVYVDMGEKFTLGVGHRYESTNDGNTSQLTTEIFYNINEEWKIKIYERFDFNNVKLEEQEYTIFKDLHSWLAEFSIDVRDGTDYTAWLIFRLKAFPEIPIGMFRTTYQRPQPGARH